MASLLSCYKGQTPLLPSLLVTFWPTPPPPSDVIYEQSNRHIGSCIGGHGPSAQGGPAFLARGGQGWVALSDRVRGVPCRPGQGFQLWRFCAKVAILRASGDFARKWRFCAKVAILCKSGDLEGPRGTRISWRFIFTTQKVAILKSCGNLPVPWLLLP